MSLYQLKTQFQNQLRPISNALVEQNVTANQVTVSAVLLSIGTAYIIAKPAAEQQRLWLLLPSSLFVRMALNAIDGMMAREHGQASTLGAVLNEVGDMVADTALLASLAPHILTPHINNKERQTVIANLPTNISTSQHHITGLIALSIGTELLGVTSNTMLDVRANQGPLGKSDRAFILGVLGAFMGIRPKRQ
ncbi:CDP-diacylglycerol-glycerol-3-phosphate 3-phosphatidyltransferase [Psychrobacter sp. JCM 18901]|uniref:CDP-alcohol phosphatidyltransferase family protein n=1 Tax=Psychrobacter sp. JCM 18901 TaxID=1298609 RepID=UPI000433237F|nr:CDP-alcohol phosphatidyltransferase family protein [Psychrobacter sp. JCM 18901]GAF56420.1 CDP-diacylglycerol-glycerol-3-phosphate 3-phosphatidyltransferase [Psychrobacter sp. JCM 18901]